MFSFYHLHASRTFLCTRLWRTYYFDLCAKDKPLRRDREGPVRPGPRSASGGRHSGGNWGVGCSRWPLAYIVHATAYKCSTWVWRVPRQVYSMYRPNRNHGSDRNRYHALGRYCTRQARDGVSSCVTRVDERVIQRGGACIQKSYISTASNESHTCGWEARWHLTALPRNYLVPPKSAVRRLQDCDGHDTSSLIRGMFGRSLASCLPRYGHEAVGVIVGARVAVVLLGL